VSARDRLLPLYWERPEYRHAWQLCFEKEANRRPLLVQVLRHLPSQLGTLEFLDDLPGERFVLLVTYDEEDEGALQNALAVFHTLAVTRAVTFFGAEGAYQRVGLEWARAFPDDEIRRDTTEDLFAKHRVTPLEAAAMLIGDPVENRVVLWGIEDQALYQLALQKYRDRAPDLQAVLDRRVPVLFDNLLAELNKRGVAVAGASITRANYWEGRELLRQRGVAHAGISATQSGQADRGALDRRLRGEEKEDEFTAAIRQAFGPAE
jgi:hypothetical protein